MKYFTMAECTRSATANARGIDNTPGPEHLRHIAESVERLLDPLREEWGATCAARGWGSPSITVSSGYRGFRLNEAVGGSTTSAHSHGYAFDLVPGNGRMSEFKSFCRSFLVPRAFDQLISEDENAAGVPRWMHVGYKSPRGEQRRQLLTMHAGKYGPFTG